MGKNGLRFGVICDNTHIEEWQVNCIKKLLELEGVEASLLLLLNHKQSKQLKGRSSLKSFITRRSVSITDMLNKVTILECELVKTEACVHFSKNDLEKVSELELDFLLNFCLVDFDEELVNLPRYGVWAFQYSSDLNRYYWDIYNEDSVTFAGLLQFSQHKKRLSLKQGCFSTIKDSYKKNRELITSTISVWPALVCRDILNDNAEYMNHSSVYEVTPNVVKPTLIQKGKFTFKLLNNKCQKIFSKFFTYEYWNIGIVHKPIHEFLNDPEANINWIVQKDDLYYADPFAYHDEGELRILMEEVDYRVVKGYISAASIKGNVVIFDQALMKLPCHMSYPFILEYKNQVYCIPETSEAKEVSIYKLNKTSKEWEKVKTILKDFHAVDSTVIQQGDYWWLFCTKSFSTTQSHNNELHIFYSSDLFGEWKPHRLNPVKIDIRSSRPAGTPFYHEGAVIRPAQDCSKTYGGRIVLNKIKILTTSQFEEEAVSYIQPKSDSMYPDGVHTISSAGRMTIIDGKRFDYNFSHFFRKLYKYRPVSLDNGKSVHLEPRYQKQVKQVK
jgi:hypothetical protein